MQFPATLPLAGRKAPSPQPNRQFFRPNLSISGNFQQLWVQLAVKLPLGAKQAKNFRLDLFISGNFQQLCVQLAVKPPIGKRIFYSGSIHFMQFPATLPLAGRKAPFQQPNREFFQTGIIHFRQFPATLGSTGKKTSPVAEYGIYFKLDLSISGNFQQICVQLVEKHPFQQPNRDIFLDQNYPFQAIPATLGSTGKKTSPVAKYGIYFKLDLSISGNFQQIYLQLGEKCPFQQPNRDIFLDWNYPLQGFSSNFGFSWQKMLEAEHGHIIYWIYPFHPISSNFRFSQQKSPLPPGSEQGKNLDWIYPFQEISSNFGFS